MKLANDTTQATIRDLVRSDVELLWWSNRDQVVYAVRNFAAQRFIRLPVDSVAEKVVEMPVRDAVNGICRARALPVGQRQHVYRAALIALSGLPLGMGLASPFGILHDLDQIIEDAPLLADAVQQTWTTLDDPAFWMQVATRSLYMATSLARVGTA